jgi:hypothetical protein
LKPFFEIFFIQHKIRSTMAEQQQQLQLQQQDKDAPSLLPLVFVATALVNQGGDPVSPQIVGVYTTQQRALDNARRFFEYHAGSYQNGKFQYPLGDEFGGGQKDLSDSLVLREDAPCMRVFLEAEGDKDDDDENCESGIAVAINAIYVCADQAGPEEPVPLLREGYNGLKFSSWRVKETTNVSCFMEEPQQGDAGGNRKKKKKVHVLMDAYYDRDDGEQNDPTLVGVFFENEKDIAMSVAKECFDRQVVKQFILDGTITDNTKTIGERGAVISYDGVPSYGIAMDTFVLDEDYVAPPVVDDKEEEYDEETEEEQEIVPKAGDELNFGQRSSGVYIGPAMHFCDHKYLQKKKCSVCKVEQGIVWYCDKEWMKRGDDPTCEACLRTAAAATANKRPAGDDDNEDKINNDKKPKASHDAMHCLQDGQDSG